MKTTFENCQNPNPKKPCTMGYCEYLICLSSLAITKGVQANVVVVVGGTHLKTTFENCQNPNPKKPCTMGYKFWWVWS